MEKAPHNRGVVNVQFFLALTLVLAVSVLSLHGISQLLEASKWTRHTHVVIEKLNVLMLNLFDAQSTHRGYLISGDEAYLVPHQAALSKVSDALQELKAMTADNTDQQQRLKEFGELIAFKMAQVKERIDIRRTQGLQAAVDAFTQSTDRQVMDEFRQKIAAMIRAEDNLLLERSAGIKLQSRFAMISILAGTVLSLVFFLVAFGLLKQEIGRRREAEESVAQLNGELKGHVEKLEAVNKELDAFTYTVSHDLRAPLRAIDGFSRVIVSDYGDKLDEEGKRLLNIVCANTVNMGRLIDDLLAFSRLGRQEVKSAPIDMKKLIHEIYEEMRPNMAGRSVNLEVKDLPGGLGDVRLVRQVVVNLISNALKYSRTKNDASIEIGGRREEKENVYYVKDNGIGFDMQYAGKLFGVFQRLHSVAQFEGTGVGLAIVHRIIVRHGGRVWAEGKINEGAVFYFTLPQAEGV